MSSIRKICSTVLNQNRVETEFSQVLRLITDLIQMVLGISESIVKKFNELVILLVRFRRILNDYTELAEYRSTYLHPLFSRVSHCV